LQDGKRLYLFFEGFNLLNAVLHSPEAPVTLGVYSLYIEPGGQSVMFNFPIGLKLSSEFTCRLEFSKLDIWYTEKNMWQAFCFWSCFLCAVHENQHANKFIMPILQ